MLVFRVLGSWIRGLYLMGFGAFWLAVAYYLSYFGQTPTVLGAGLMGMVAFGSGLVIVIRGLMLTQQRSPLPEGSAGWRDDGSRAASDTGFDPDAAIARYMQNRPAGEAQAAAATPEPQPSAPPRPSFGRKQV